MNYNIEGEPLPVVICNLEANETMITEKGAMSWMTPNMKMETTSNGGDVYKRQSVYFTFIAYSKSV